MTNTQNATVGAAPDSSVLEEAKNYLDMPWADDETERKLQGIIERGQRYLNSVAGGILDYTVDDLPRALLFDYCRYVLNNAFDEFAKNYNGDLINLRMTRDETIGVPDSFIATYEEVQQVIDEDLKGGDSDVG